ncbi:MAG: DUF1080 domain-containing protein [Saprospiraceae bacterium]|nr:DUF1080 domain-containing protein [Saprospiraceae bacterium]
MMPIPTFVYPLSTVGNADWKVDNGVISCDKGEGFFQTTNNFQHFDLSVDFKPEGDINSGIFLGCQGRELSATGCYEVNIWDNHPNQDFRTGSIVTRAKPISKVDSKGKWNNYMIRVRPGNISVMLNGTPTAFLKVDSEITSSPIAFQKFGKGKISFKNFKIERR